MANIKRSKSASTSQKDASNKGKGANKVPDVKTSKSKPAAATPKPAGSNAAPKTAAKKTAKKSVAKPAAAKKPAKAPAAKPSLNKAVAKKAPAKSAPVKPASTKKAAPAPTSKAPAKAAKQAAANVSGKSAATAAGKPTPRFQPPKPAGKPAALKGKIASALPSAARGDSNNQEKNQSSTMNKNAAKSDNGVTKEDGRYALPSHVTIDLPKSYRPSNDDEYMGPKHLAYFRNKLRTWRDQLVEESRQTMENLRDEVRDVGDEAERATRETENSLELRTRDRYRKLIARIDGALRRIEDGRYGFCEETDEEIGLDRLDARPIAKLSLDAQERREHLQKQMGD